MLWKYDITMICLLIHANLREISKIIEFGTLNTLMVIEQNSWTYFKRSIILNVKGIM